MWEERQEKSSELRRKAWWGMRMGPWSWGRERGCVGLWESPPIPQESRRPSSFLSPEPWGPLYQAHAAVRREVPLANPGTWTCHPLPHPHPQRPAYMQAAGEEQREGAGGEGKERGRAQLLGSKASPFEPLPASLGRRPPTAMLKSTSHPARCS